MTTVIDGQPEKASNPFAGHRPYWIGGSKIGCERCDVTWRRVDDCVIETPGERDC